MRLLRNFVLTFAAIATLLAPLGAVSSVEAQTHHRPQHAQTRVYWVYYRTCPHASWVCYGGYYITHQAQQAVTWFQYYGYDTFVR